MSLLTPPQAEENVDAKLTRAGVATVAGVILLVVASIPLWPPGFRAEPIPSAAPTLADLPLTFVENRGQAPDDVALYAQGPGYTFAFAPGRVLFGLRDEGSVRVELALEFVDGDVAVVPEGTDPTGGSVNYLRGSDAAGWQTDIPAFSGVVYRELWPGIDLHLRGDEGTLKYEFHLAPGARPSDIRLTYAGATRIGLDREGGLLVGTPLGELRDSPPISYQLIDGAHQAVDSHYLLTDGSGHYGFTVGSYDPEHVLVIDPGLEFSTFLGGSSHEQVHDVAVDAAGNAVVVGMTQSDDFPTTPGAIDRTFNGGVMDVFVAKFDATGSALVYATYMGGVPAPLRRGTETPLDVARAVAVDGAGNAYVTGQTTSPAFPTTSGSFQPVINTSDDVVTDAFVSKLSPTGSLVYSTFLGGSFWEDGRDIAVDAAGNAYVVGETSSDNFPTTAGAAQPARAGQRDAFVTKLNANGSGVLYSTYLGGASELDRADAVALDDSGAIYVAGSTRSTDFPTTPGSFQPVHSGGGFADLFEVFVTKLSPAGAISYSTFLGTPRMDLANDLAVDDTGSAYVTGVAGLASEFPTTAGAYDRTAGTGSRAFVTKLDPTGSNLVYSTFFRVTNIALNSDGSAWLAGGTGAGAETTEDAFARDNAGGSDAYLARLDPTGSAIEFATYLGGAQSDGAAGVAPGPDGSVFIAGNTMSADFPTTLGAFDRTWAGDPLVFWGDGFLAKFSDEGGGDTTPPPPQRDTANFSGRVEGNQTVTHNLAIGNTGPVDLSLTWKDSRANLTIRARDPAGNSVFFDGSSAGSKSGTFTAAMTGTYRFEVSNTASRKTDYGLSVTYPSGASSTPPSGSLNTLSLNPASVTGGTASTGTVTLTMGAPSGGASVLLSSSNTAVATVPPSVTVPSTQTSATFTVSTSSVSVNTPVTISATYNGVTRTATLSVNAPDAGAVSTISLDPTTVPGGATSTATVTLTGPAPSGGAVVAMSSSNTAVATVPPSVTVPAGATTASVTVSTSPQQFNQSSAIAASYGGVTRSSILSVTAGAVAALSSVSVNPTSVTGGTSSTGTVTLTGAAPSGGLTVALSSSHAAAAVPASVTVAAGQTSASFTVATTSVTSSTSATITATHADVTRTTMLTVDAPTSSTDTVTISRLEFDASKGRLRVEASSSGSGATLRAYVTATDQLIGTLSDGKGVFNWPTNPQNVTVRSSLGGEASRNVTVK